MLLPTLNDTKTLSISPARYDSYGLLPVAEERRLALASRAPSPTMIASPVSARGGGPGEPGGTRAMGVCEPGQGGNAAAISNTFMCPGEPPRLSRPPADRDAARDVRVPRPAGRSPRRLSPHRVPARRSAPRGPRTRVEKAVELAAGESRDGARADAESASAAPSPIDPDAGDPTRRPRAACRLAEARLYTVVARRYRPQRFEDVVGQDHVVQALRNAIRLNRVAQAYLFCGTRGVGKTSMARIFAKCLNCVQGPTESPCQVCDICQAIAVGPGRRRHRDRRGQQQRRRAGARAAAERRAAAQPVPVQDLLHRRSAHALDRGLQRPAQDAGRAAAARQVLLRDDRGEQDPDHGPLAVPAVRLRRDHARGDRRTPWRRSATASRSRPSPRRCRSSPAGRAARCATPSRCWSSCSPRAARG